MTAFLDWVRAHPDTIWRAAQQHVWLAGLALAATVALAVPLGIALTRYGRAAGPAVAIVNALRTVPSLALLVFMLPLLGIGALPSVVALVLYGLPAVLLNTIAGLSGVDPDVVEAARGQGLSPGEVLRRVELPLAAPVIVAGIRTAAVQIVSAATLAVFIGGGGLGELISSGMAVNDMRLLLAGALAVAALAGLTEAAFAAAEWALARRVAGRARA